MTPLFKLLKTNDAIVINFELFRSFHELNNVLDNGGQITLKQPLKDKQMASNTGASFTAARYALMTEDDQNQKIKSKRKAYAPIAFGS